jgi:5'-methylthioadenosine phosphorylase/5'-methylthioinosine phosphorylase
MIIAIIGGSGLSQLPGLTIEEEIIIDTPWGKPSAPIMIGKLIAERQPNKTNIVFLPRHGNPHSIPPHKINYRANIWALKEIGTKKIISVNAVGGITKLMKPSSIVVPDQIIDYTHDRGNTFYEDEEVKHIDFTMPYSETLRDQLIEAARIIKLEIHKKGVYGVTQGPRLETTAEILKLEKDGCNIVGMTAMPEASLAKELSIDYASYCLVVNWAAGKSVSAISMDIIEENLEKGLKNIKELIIQIVNFS